MTTFRKILCLTACRLGYFNPNVNSAKSIALFLALLFIQLAPAAQAKIEEGDLTRFSPDEGQPLFPVGNLNVFKQYVVGFNESERVGKTVGISLPWPAPDIEFGGELAASVNANFGFEFGLCFGGNADFDLAFKPKITLPDRYPSEIPIPLTVAEGLRPDSYFTTTFPPLGKAYADLIFEVGANLHARACVFGCVEGINFGFSTCDIPPIGGNRLFRESVRCDPALDEETYCAIELASFNRGDDNVFRVLNVAAKDRIEFIAEPYKEFAPSVAASAKKPFSADPAADTISVSGVQYFKDDKQVKLSSEGTLPGGLSGSEVYYVANLSASGASGVNFQLTTKLNGPAVNIRNEGSGAHEVFLYETNKPDTPSFGKYGEIAISAPTVGTDSRVSDIDDSEKPFSVVDDSIAITALPGYRNGTQVRVFSVGQLPEGLSEGCVYYVTNAQSGGLGFQLSTKLGDEPVNITSPGTGTHRITRVAEFSSAQSLKSTGAEDIAGINIDVAGLMSDLLFPPTFPSLQDSGSEGPLDWNYTLASLEVGPAIQLQTDFEMTWDLVVTDIKFRMPGTAISRSVKIDGQTVSDFSQVNPKRTVHLTNTGPYALPLITLINEEPVEVTITYRLAPKLKTVVKTPFIGRVQYEALAAGASIDRVGELAFGPLIKDEHKFKFGEFTVFDGSPSPIESGAADTDYDIDRYSIQLINTIDSLPQTGCAVIIIREDFHIRIFDTIGEVVEDGPAAALLSPALFTSLQDQLSPWPNTDLLDIEEENIFETATATLNYQPGTISFIMQSAGPPSFDWNPSQIGMSFGTPFWQQIASNPTRTNWVEKISDPVSIISYPGQAGGTRSDVLIDASPFPTLWGQIEIASLTLAKDRRLDIFELEGGVEANLTVGGGLAENRGLISISGNNPTATSSFLKLNSPDAVLCGPGTVELSKGGSLLGYEGSEPFSFTNYNTISGVGSAMDQYSVDTITGINNVGTYRSETDLITGLLITSAKKVLNQGIMESTENSDFSVYGEQFNSRIGSLLAADGIDSSTYFSFDEVEHAGLVSAKSGGLISIGPWNQDRALWHAGQSFTNDVGFFRAKGTDSMIQLDRIDMTGGCFDLAEGGVLDATDAVFTGTVFNIGDFNPVEVDPSSGLFSLDGPNSFTAVILTNNGTLRMPGEAEFKDTMLFANNGIVEIPSGGLLHIYENTIDTTAEGASDGARNQPGTANATRDTLLGGTWDISGTLVIDGASFTRIGGNAAQATTTSGSIDGLGEKVLNIENDPSRRLSLGAAAELRLRGTQWSFSALDSLYENAGAFQLLEGAQFSTSTENPDNPQAGDFVNYGDLLVDSGSVLTTNGTFIQRGAQSKTEIEQFGAIVSMTNDYQILGGLVTVGAEIDFLNRTGNTFAAGTTIRIASPLVDANQINPITGSYDQERVILDFDPSIQFTSIPEDVDITLHGAAIEFQALTENLISNAGKLTLSGDGIDNPASTGFAKFTGDVFTNTGEVNVLGFTSEFRTAGYVQNGADSLTVIGAGARLTAIDDVLINDGEIVLEIASRPEDGLVATINTSSIDFGNRLVINFIGDLVQSPPDIGDTWMLISKTNSAPIAGVDTNNIAYRLDGSVLPWSWLPPDSHLEVVQFEFDVGSSVDLRGLGVRVVPDGGFLSYKNWLAANEYDGAGSSSNPMQDANEDGILNVLEYLFGPVGDNGLFSGQMQQRLTSEDGMAYYEVQYVRPTGVDAAYYPYFSTSLDNWYPVDMDIGDIRPSDLGLGLEQVTLKTNFPLPEHPIFFRIQGELNTEPLDYGLLPSKALAHDSGLENLDETIRDSLGKAVDYTVAPGLVLFFNVRGKLQANGGTVYGGTAEDGVTRNFIYQDRSSLSTAAVHAGLLDNDEQGIIKVTFIEQQTTPYISSRQNGNTNNQVDSQAAQPSENEVYSYFIERAIKALTL